MGIPSPLQAIMRQNALITLAYSRYINYNPRFVTADMVEDLARECDCPTHDAYLLLLAAAMGLDTVDDKEHKLLDRLYIQPGVKKLDPEIYAADAYCQIIRFPSQKLGKWETMTSTYTAYEPFVWRDPILLSDFREIPQIGYFEQDFHFPAIHENGVEWMSVKPNEVETMRAPIASSHGRVLTLGLGLGYFAFHASQKDDVESVTVIEREADVIDLFKSLILPQFPNGNKIKIIQSDAFDYVKNQLPQTRFDYIFADLWHDASDGLELYMKLKKLESNVGNTPVDYWIEPSLLSYLRGMVYDKINDPKSPLKLQGISPEEYLSNDFLKTLKLF